MALTGSVNAAPVPVRFGGPGSTSSERDCIIIGEFTPQMNKIRVRLKGLGPNPNTGIDNRKYNREAGDQDCNIIGVVGRGRWDQGLLDTQPEAAMALHRGMGNNNGENYAYSICVCESGEVRGRRQVQPMDDNVDTLKHFGGIDPIDMFSYVADFLDVGQFLTAEQEFTFTFEKLAVGSVRTRTDGGSSPFTADEEEQYLRVTLDFEWTSGGATPGARNMSLIFDTKSGGGLWKNAYVFIGNPFAFWQPHEEVTGAIAGVQVLSIEYFDGAEPVVTAAPTLLPATAYYVPVVSLSATDNVGVVSYLLTCPGAEPTEQPLADDARWSPVPPNFADVDGGAQVGTGDYVFYPWVKDAAGNINTVANAVANAATVTLTIA